MITDINELIHSIAKENANNDEEKVSLKLLYGEYRIPFYYIALSILKNEKKAKNAAAEAFKRISDTAYRFDEELNAQYWFFDIIFTLCANAAGDAFDEKTQSIPNVPKDLVIAPEEYIKIYSTLENADIASITGQKKSEVSKKTKNQERWEIVKNIAPQYCVDYWDIVAEGSNTGFENFSEKERTISQEEKTHERRTGTVKRTIAIILVVTFVCSAIMTAILLITKKFGSDVDKNLASDDIVLQFNNSIAVAKINDSIYFCKDNALFKYDSINKSNIKISDDNPKEIISDGTYIYYRNLKDGYMYRIDSDGNNKTALCDKPGGAMAIYGDKIYFSTGDGIFSIPTSGGNIADAELLLDISSDDNLYCVDIEIDSVGNVFFASGIGKGVHHITEFKGEPSLEGIFADEVYTIKIDNDNLYFDYKEASGKIFLYKFDIVKYIEAADNERVLPQVVYDSTDSKTELSTGAFSVKDNIIYFAGEEGDNSVIYKIDEEGNRQKLTEIPKNEVQARQKLVVSDIHVFENKLYYFCSDGKAGGDRAFFEYDMNTNITNKIF